MTGRCAWVLAAILATGAAAWAQSSSKEYVDLVRRLAAEGKAEEALALACRAIEQDPAEAECWLVRAAVYCSLGRLDQGFQDLQRAEALDGASTLDVHRRLGEALLGGKESAARAPAARVEPVVRILHLRNVQAAAIAGVVTSMAKAWNDRNLRVNVSWDSMNNLLISGDPSAVKTIEEEVGKLDLPPVEFTLKLYLLRAADRGEADAEIKDLAPVIEYLKGVVRYQSFSVMHTGILRMQERGEGRLTLGAPQAAFHVLLVPSSADRESRTVRFGEVDLRQTWTTRSGQNESSQERTILHTSVQLKDGEVAVLGASRIDGEDEALVLVVRCDFVK